MVAAARAAGMRLLGPNCMSLFVARSRLNLTGIPDLRAGRLAFVSQSGNLVYDLVEHGRRSGLGLSLFLSLGNQADLGFEDVLDAVLDDPETAAAALYVEAVRPGQGRAFLEAVHRLARAKPVVALIGGRTDSGRRASASHTAALLSDVRELRGILRQAGAIEVTRLDELFPVADALVKSPPPSVPTVALCGGGGGHATVGSDALEALGIALPPPAAETQRALRANLPADGVGPEPDRLDGRLRPELLGLSGRGATPPRRPRDRRPDPVRPLWRLPHGPRDPGQQLPGRRGRPRRSPAGDGQANPPPLDLCAAAPRGVRGPSGRGSAAVRIAGDRRRRVPRARRARSSARPAAGADRRRGRPAHALRRPGPGRRAPGPPRARSLGLAREPRGSRRASVLGADRRGRRRVRRRPGRARRGQAGLRDDPPQIRHRRRAARRGRGRGGPVGVRGPRDGGRDPPGRLPRRPGRSHGRPGVDVVLGVARSELGGHVLLAGSGRDARRGARRCERPPCPPWCGRRGGDARRDACGARPGAPARHGPARARAAP